VKTTKESGPGSSFILTADEVTTSGPDTGGGKAMKNKMRKASLGGAGAQQ
jgi:hypothetical protein